MLRRFPDNRRGADRPPAEARGEVSVVDGALPVHPAAALRAALGRIDGRGYPAYKALVGAYDFPEFRLCIDHVQADPFASPSHLRLLVPAAVAAVPRELFRDRVRRVALQDFLIRAFAAALGELSGSREERSGGGMLAVDCGGQEILERSAARVEKAEGAIEVRCVASLPGVGRSVAGREADRLLCEILPQAAVRSLLYRNLPRQELKRFIECAEDQAYLRHQLDGHGLVAFVGDGAVLPRRSGCDDGPLAAPPAVRFAAPASLRVTLEAPHAGPVVGMGVPRGVTLIVGGGFHGKSTLLHALERGVYNHVPGDGRERVVTQAGAVKIRAEEGRHVNGLDISAFVGPLPGGIDTRRFSSEDCSGATSQAAAIVEAIEAGATCLLMDEDTCATNFMIRDDRMQALVPRDREPITPFVDRVAGLYRDLGVSTVLVMGGSGDYFAVADTVVMMDGWTARDRTRDALRIAREIPGARRDEAAGPVPRPARRAVRPESLDPSRGHREVKLAARARHRLQFGAVDIDLEALSQLVDISQTRAIGEILVFLRRRAGEGEFSVGDLLDHVCREMELGGLDAVAGRPVGYLATPRRYEIAGALNRLRGGKFRQL